MVNPHGLRVLLDAKLPVVVLDARSGKYDDGRRIPTAHSLHAGSAPEEVAKVVPEKNALIVTYCANVHCPASNNLAKRLEQLGYHNVIEMPQGIDGWVAAGYPVNQPAK